MTMRTSHPMIKQPQQICAWIILLLLVTSLNATGQEADKQNPVHFETELLPVFKAKCLSCHSSTKSKGGLNLETPQTILQGADSGDVIIPGNGETSFLYQVTANQVEDTIMPPKDNKSNALPFTTSELALLRRWIDEGAKGTVLGTKTVAWQKMPPNLRTIHATAISPDGTIAVCGRANQIHAYHLKTQTLEGRPTDPALADSNLYGMEGAAHRDFVQALVFHPDGNMLASGGYRIIKLWERSFEEKATSIDLKTIFKGENNCLSFVHSTGNIELQHLELTNETETFHVPNHHLTCAAISPNGHWLAGGSHEGGLFFWRIETRELVHREEQAGGIHALVWFPDVSGVFVGGSDGLIRRWEKTNDPDFAVRLQSVWQAHDAEVKTLDLPTSPTAQLVSTGVDGSLNSWEWMNGNLEASIQIQSDRVKFSTLQLDSQQWATLNDNGSISIWNTTNGERVIDMKPHPNEGAALAAAERSKAMAESWLKANQSDLKNLEEASTKAKERLTKAKEGLNTSEKELKEKEETIQAAVKQTNEKRQNLTQFQESIHNATEALEIAEKNAQGAKDKALEAARQSAPSDQAALETLIQETADLSFAAGQSKESFDRITANKEDRIEQLQKTIKESEEQLKKLENELPPLKMKHNLAKTEWELATQADQSNTLAIQLMKETIADRENLLNEASQRLEQRKLAQNPFQSQHWTLSFSSDGSILAAVASDGSWRTWTIADGEPLESGKLSTHVSNTIITMPDTSQWLIAGDTSLTLLNSQPTWNLKDTLGNGASDSPMRDRVNALAFSPDGEWLAAGGGEPSRNGEITIWNMRDRTLTKNLDRIHSDTVLGLEFSPDGQFLASAGSDKFAKVINCQTSETVLNMEGHTHHVMDIAWKSDGRQLATAGADKVVKIWEFPSGNRKKNLEGFEKQASATSFVGLTGQLVISSGDTTVRLVDAEGKVIRTFESIPDFQQSTAITPDGTLIATGGDDGCLRIFQPEQSQANMVFEAP